jgi:uncharacterized protein YndB with AHSA1/START domain
MATLAEHVAGKEQSSLKLEMTRVIKASRQRVFDAWTRPEMIRQWFGPEGKMVAEVNADAKVGGSYGISMTGKCDAEEGKAGEIDMRRDSMVSGRYIKVDPYDLLQFTWKGNWEPTEETTVTIELRDVDGGTELKLTQERFMTESSQAQHEYGWTGSLDKLELFAAETA